MRVLLTNNHLARLGGSEVWTLTMAREFIRRGYEVGVFTHQKGVVSNMLADYLDDDPKDYDLALINHNSCIDVGAKKKIYTSHGWFDPLERPVPGADKYVAVSENVAKRWQIDTIIKNPVDTELFAPKSEIRETPERILAVTDVPVPFAALSPTRKEYTMPDLMNEADLVITIGRGVLEAMSCARNVIVWDKRGWMGEKSDGYLADFSTLHGNVGGAYEQNTIDWDKELSKYRKEHGQRNREYILQNHDVRKIVDQYLAL